jgi:hypothetical protein
MLASALVSTWRMAMDANTTIKKHANSAVAKVLLVRLSNMVDSMHCVDLTPRRIRTIRITRTARAAHPKR